MISCAFEDGSKASLRHVVVDTIVIKDEHILLVKRAANLNHGGRWALPGGYVDRDERIKDAAVREVLEETGWKVEEVNFLTVVDNPERGDDRQNVGFVFFAAAVEQIHNPDDESEQVEWFPIDKLPPKEKIAFDHGEMIDLYKKHKKMHSPLPGIF